MYSDAHFHLNDRMKSILQKKDVAGMISCSTPLEAKEAQKFLSTHPSLTMSCGIHPWHVEESSWEEMLPYLQNASIIGEIGMDNVWCHTDENLQEDYFVKQLKYAMQYHKPVVLHTKGKEKRILELIRQYPNIYLVHWYSCMQFIEEYRDLGCYFSIGPFPSLDNSVKKVVEKIPLHHLLIETDGIGAIEWALQRSIKDDAYFHALYQIASEIGEIKEKTPQEILYITNQNLQRFLSNAPNL